jgi:hypothetical protein
MENRKNQEKARKAAKSRKEQEKLKMKAKSQNQHSPQKSTPPNTLNTSSLA